MPNHFWREIWIQVLVILLQLYRTTVASNFTFYWFLGQNSFSKISVVTNLTFIWFLFLMNWLNMLVDIQIWMHFLRADKERKRLPRSKIFFNSIFFYSSECSTMDIKHNVNRFNNLMVYSIIKGHLIISGFKDDQAFTNLSSGKLWLVKA